MYEVRVYLVVVVFVLFVDVVVAAVASELLLASLSACLAAVGLLLPLLLSSIVNRIVVLDWNQIDSGDASAKRCDTMKWPKQATMRTSDDDGRQTGRLAGGWMDGSRWR